MVVRPRRGGTGPGHRVVIAPTGEKPPVQFARPEPAPAVAAPEKLGRYASPIRYAYSPACENGSAPCSHWVLVAWGGERGRLPGTDAADSLSLSPDGTRAAYLRTSNDAYVVADLRTGAVKALPVRLKGGTVGEMFGAQVPLFSLDGRHLLIQRDHLDKDTETVEDNPMIVDLGTGAVRDLPAVGQVVGWTSAGLMTMTSRRTNSLPGHTTSASFTVCSPKGKVAGRLTLPGNLAESAMLSPSRHTMATLAREVTPDGVVGHGIVLTDTSTGRPARTVAPRLPAGRQATRILRWDGEDAVVVRTSGPRTETAYHVVDLATGAAPQLDIRMSDVADQLLRPAEPGVALGKVRQ
ncbi:hypothetical protein ACIBI9_12215 [Nonomuraea sp. NPDC050451]|uniref:hypothetical protein n=1 Tax=Nonomuraea sp. NPDC050451 TaxID=3364364 RepID=UPI00379DB7EB